MPRLAAHRAPAVLPHQRAPRLLLRSAGGAAHAGGWASGRASISVAVVGWGTAGRCERPSPRAACQPVCGRFFLRSSALAHAQALLLRCQGGGALKQRARLARCCQAAVPRCRAAPLRPQVYCCLVEGCGRKFCTIEERKQHLVGHHRFPKNYAFDRIHLRCRGQLRGPCSWLAYCVVVLTPLASMPGCFLIPKSGCLVRKVAPPACGGRLVAERPFHGTAPAPSKPSTCARLGTGHGPKAHAWANGVLLSGVVT